MSYSVDTNRQIAKFCGYKHYSAYDHIPNSDVLPGFQFGWKLHDKPVKDYKKGKIGKRVYLANNHFSLKFHESFEWLWCFFENLERKGYFFSINNNYCCIKSADNKIITQQSSDLTFNACYNAAKEFLTFFYH